VDHHLSLRIKKDDPYKQLAAAVGVNEKEIITFSLIIINNVSRTDGNCELLTQMKTTVYVQFVHPKRRKKSFVG
jgi:hypothetical protein